MARPDAPYTISAIDKTKKTFANITKRLRSAGKSVLKFGSIIGGGLLAGFGAGLAKTVRDTDRLGKVSQRLGVGVEALSAWSFAASQAGIESNQFTLAVQRMRRRVGEAAKGTGEARGALRELGINARQFQALGLDEQLREVGAALRSFSESDQLRLAFKLFDAEGVAMLQLLKMQQAEIDGLLSLAKRLGLVVDEELRGKIEGIESTWGKALGAITGFFLKFIDQNAPTIEKLIDLFAFAAQVIGRKLIQAFNRLPGIFQTIAEFFNQYIAPSIEFLQKAGRFVTQASPARQAAGSVGASIVRQSPVGFAFGVGQTIVQWLERLTRSSERMEGSLVLGE